MASSFPMKKGVVTRVVFPLLDADGDLVSAAAGLDSEGSLDGGSFTNLTDEAHEIATSSGVYYLDLTVAETSGDVVAIKVTSTTSGCKPTLLVFYTAARTVDDLAYPTTTGRSIDVTAAGEVGIDWANIGGPTTAQSLSGTTVKTATDVETDTSDIQSRIPGVLVGGRMDSDIGAKSGNVALSAQEKLDVNVEVDTALVDVDLDHLIQVTAGIEEPTDGAYLDQIMHKAVGQTFDDTTDSLEALRDTAPMGTTMRGTDNAALASVCTEARVSRLDATVSSRAPEAGGNVADIKGKTDSLTFTTAAKVDARVDYVGANAVTSPNDFKADVTNLDIAVSSRAPEVGGNLVSVKDQTDKLNFDVANYVSSRVKAEDNIDFGATKKASINTEVSDVLAVDTYTELAAVPTPPATIAHMLQLVFQYFRNKRTVTSSTETTFKEDDGTTLGQATVADDGTTFTKGKLG